MAEVDHIDANVAAGFCAGMDKILILAVVKRRLLQKERNWSQFCLDNQHLHKTLQRSISLRNITPTNMNTASCRELSNGHQWSIADGQLTYIMVFQSGVNIGQVAGYQMPQHSLISLQQ